MRTRHILPLAAIMVLMASCASVSSYVSRTAKTQMVEPASIQQLPLVVELQVEPTLYSRDTTWYYVKSTNFNRKEATNYLTAEVLRQHQADVLILPRVSFEKERRNKNYTCHMKVEGYPARYTNFHTATKQDIQLLTGDFKEKADTIYCPIIINVTENQATIAPKQEKAAVDKIAEQLSEKVALPSFLKKKKGKK